MRRSGSILAAQVFARWLLILLGCGLFAGKLAAEALATRTLSYLPAEAVVEHLRQVFPEQEVRISGMNNQLIIRARDTSTLEQVQTLISELDRRPHQFRIRLRQASDRFRQDEGAGVSGTVTRKSGNMEITTRRESRSSLGTNQQMVTVLENTAVALQQGQLRPVRDLWIGPNGVATSTRYQPVGDALLLTPRRVGGNQVEISIRASHSSENDRNPQRLDQLELITQRIVAFGEWVELGTVNQNQQQRREGWIHYSTQQERNLGSYEIMVEALD